jgi:hypothetical protein
MALRRAAREYETFGSSWTPWPSASLSDFHNLLDAQGRCLAGGGLMWAIVYERRVRESPSH